MKFYKKIAATALAFAILLTGCMGGNTGWAYESDGSEVSSGLYILNQIVAFSKAETKLIEENADDIGYTSPTPSEMLKMTIEGQPAADWISNEAQKSVKGHIAVRKKFKQLGLTLSEVEVATINTNVANVMSQSKSFYESNGVSEASIREYYTSISEQGRVFLALYGEGGEFAVPEDEIKKRFAEDYYMVDALPMYFYYSVPEGETKTLEELNSEIKTTAEDFKKRLDSGEDITELVYEWDLKNATEETKADVVKPEKGQATYIISEDTRASFGETLTDAVMKAQVGETGIAEDEYYAAVFKRLDIMEDPAAFAAYKEMVLYELKSAEFDEKISEWAAVVPVTENTAAIERYKPSKIKFAQSAASVPVA